MIPLPGRPEPLGATWDGSGVNFALFTSCATRVDLCLFDGPHAQVERERIALPSTTGDVWHGYLPEVAPGQLYGYRVEGPYDPSRGHRCNSAKLLFDPYARQVGRTLDRPDLFLDAPHSGDGSGPDRRDTAPWAPLGMVVDDAFDWQDDAPPDTPWSDTIIYELHVTGLTRRCPGVAAPLRGTYLGLVEDAVLDHLIRLGVTAVELLPAHHHVSEPALAALGLTNYWGYNTLGYFAPDLRYATAAGAAVREFKTMVRRLHAAGLEVILDVVYNHTAEGDTHGPTLSWRGIDNAAYYRLQPDDRCRYLDTTGCGNSLDLQQPAALRLVLDSLRYWVQEMHVDGFRFDLASTLVRDGTAVHMDSAFCTSITRDPVLSQVKLIAEPWDLGHDGYQVGRFPAPFREWNDRYRDTVRRFWRGDDGQVGDLATRLAGSSDLYQTAVGRTGASVNFVTAHDGFTLLDLVSYRDKHNDANGEHGRDGTDHNLTSNAGVEGASDDPVVTGRRDRMRRSLLMTLAVSQGVPMLCAGDELGRTQYGNNNTYCQDNEISWVDWRLDHGAEAFLTFVTALLQFRADHPVLRCRRFRPGRSCPEGQVQDVSWLDTAGNDIGPRGWDDHGLKSLAMCLPGEALDAADAGGRRIMSDTVLVLFNAAGAAVDFQLPDAGDGRRWRVVLDAADRSVSTRPVQQATYRLQDRSTAILSAPRGTP